MAQVTPIGATIVVSSSSDAERRRSSQREPVTAGVPLPRGAVRESAHAGLIDDHGADVPVQMAATERWPDGSIRWALIDFQVDGAAMPQRRYRLQFNAAGRVVEPRHQVRVDEMRDRVVVDTGVARFDLRPGAGLPFAAVTIDGACAIDRARTGLFVTDAAGKTRRARITSVSVEGRGTLRSTVRLEAAIGSRRRPMVQVVVRVEFFAGSAATRVAVTLRNPRRARHRDGFWELGDHGSVYLRDASISVGLPAAAAAVECAAEIASPLEAVGVPFELYQDSSGGSNWQLVTHVNRRNEVPCAFRGYRVRPGGRDGLRATPALRVTHPSGSAAIAVEHFWQNFPRAIEADARALTFRLWPRQSADLHELQGGEQKTHRFMLAFGDDAMARDALVWGRAPSVATALPRDYAAAGAVPYLSPADEDRDDRYQRLVNAAIEGGDSFLSKREAIDEYGWRNFGDIYADHENAFSGRPDPIISHYNNQYDAINGFAIQFMRTGDARWWHQMRELAAHVTDIDIYHTDRDKAAYNHGLFWHTSHYMPAGTCSHRSYPRQPGVSGGGPANEHAYAAGLRLHWLLTGDPVSRAAAIELATWVLDMDDGRKTIFRWLTRSDTGLASATQSPDFHGPGRGAGHAILVLLDGHRLTGLRRFLSKAEQLIRRCVHPADDVAALDLLDSERRWSYTVFLQALGKYLDYKTELGEIDPRYAYARASLLHYARWMADHEYPYLEKPEILEYPTETWAAQDMRKGEVFTFAAQHTAGAERIRFVERAQFFFDASVATLLAAQTRTLARPVVLLLSNGFMQAGSADVRDRPHPQAAAAAPFGSPSGFVPQKTRAKKRLMAAAGAAALMVLLITIACLAIR